MRSIAFYGKGGIGKSTTLSNVTAALSVNGRKILQIGCDPKHDSTRLLLGGFTQLTVLDQLRTNGSVSLDSVILTGYNGIKCIESGGPEPGVGCAGRGVIQMLSLLNEQGLDTQQYDYVFFDVLGDVVCGGFAVPMRKGYADEVYIVTSGEIASLYAANNIAKGIKRFSTPCGKLGGVIGNGRDTKNERDVIAAFAKMIGTEMVAFIPRSELIIQAELQSEPILQYAPNSEIASIYQSIADHIERQQTPAIPTPFSDESLERFFSDFCYGPQIKKRVIYAQQPENNTSAPETVPKTLSQKEATVSSNSKSKETLLAKKKPAHGCSLAGAVSVVRQIKDAIAIVHSPSGCSYIHFWSHMIGDLQSRPDNLTLPNLLCTNMQETDVIFGGKQNLKDTILKVHRKLPSYTIFVITSCTAGIIGEDVTSVVDQLNCEGVTVIPVLSDGIIAGDYAAGIFSAYQGIAENFVDDTVTAIDDSVNIIGEIAIAKLGEPNFDELRKIMHGLGINVNCRFIRNTSLAELKEFKRARANILFTDEPTLSQNLPAFFKNRFNMNTLKLPLPVAFDRTEEFARALALYFNKMPEFEKLVAYASVDYARQVSSLRNYFSGKKVVVFSYSQNIDWLLSTLIDLDVGVSKVCVSTVSSNGSVLSSKYAGKIQIEQNSPIEYREQVILEKHPDFVLAPPVLSGVSYSVPCYAFPLSPDYGFNSGLEYARSLYLKSKVPFTEGWRNDKKLFHSFS